MKNILLFTACTVLAGCSIQNNPNQDALITRVEALEKEVASIRGSQTNNVPLRIAYVDQNKVNHYVYKLQRDKMAEIKKADALAPDVEGRVTQYETLLSKFTRMKTARSMSQSYARPPGYEAPTPEEFAAMEQRVAAVEPAIVEIASRRSRLSDEYGDSFAIERMVEEYAKGRFDVVIDSYSKDKVIYNQSRELADISDAIIEMVKEKAKL